MIVLFIVLLPHPEFHHDVGERHNYEGHGWLFGGKQIACPVILDSDSYDVWLDLWMKDVAAASELLGPCDARLIRCYPVNTRINYVANDDEECSRPAQLGEFQNRLFS
jgi:hypothetical protein